MKGTDKIRKEKKKNLAKEEILIVRSSKKPSFITQIRMSYTRIPEGKVPRLNLD
jgi:hypothetical protein